MTRSVIFDQLVGLEYIGSNLAAPRDIFLLTDDRVELRFLLLLFHFEETRLQDFHRSVSILELGPLILTLHDDTCRQVSDAYGGFDLIDILASRAAGAKGVDPEILFVNDNV